MGPINHHRGFMVACFSLGYCLLAGCLLADEGEWSEKLTVAASQHHVIMALIEKGKYDEVLPELRKIMDLKLPEKCEDRLTKEICIVSDKLRHKNQERLVLQILDEGLQAVHGKSNKARLYKEKGYTFRQQGNSGQAREMFRKAIDLESN